MKYSLLLLAFAGPLLLLVMGCIPNSSTDPQAQKEIIKSNPLDRVTASLPTRKTLQLFSEQPGRVEAFEEAPIHSKLAGYVETVHVDIGDKVTKAQVLVRIHAPEYQDQLEQKRGLLAQAEAELKQVESALNAAQAAVNSSKSMVIQADASVARAEAECTRWNSELQRIQQLVSKGSVTSKLADETSSQLLSAEAARKESLASVEVAKAR